MGNEEGKDDIVANGHWARNPVVVMAMVLVVSMILLIGAAVIGLDVGHVLLNMASSEYARGLITYLFAVMTIGTAIVLVLSALVTNPDDRHKEQFQRGKEILSLMLGVFGTIVGYYFGTAGVEQRIVSLKVSQVDVSPNVAAPGDKITVRAVVSGGGQPWRFDVGLGADKPEPKEVVSDNGWIVKEITVRTLRPDEPSIVHVVIQDASGRKIDAVAPLAIKTK